MNILTTEHAEGTEYARRSTDYFEIARIQLDRAIHLYYEEDYICAVTLAGAAEGYLGDYLNDSSAHRFVDINLKPKIDPDFNQTAIRNILKHGLLDKGYKEGQIVELKVKEQALFEIFKSIYNYWAATQRVTPLISKFFKEHTPEKIDKILRETSVNSAHSVVNKKDPSTLLGMTTKGMKK